MKQKLIRLSQDYVAALRQHLKPGVRAGLQPALELGRQAVALGLETLELAGIHAHALVILEISRSKPAMTRRAENFFAGTNALIEETHLAARQNQVDLSRLKKTLGQRTEQLASSRRQLQRGVVRRRVMAEAAVKNGRQHDKSLEESLELQKRLRRLTQRVLATQEDERQKISHELQDEIAQTLLGINVRLLILKQAARSGNQGFKNQIASTQRLVAKSAKSVRKFARELNVHYPALKKRFATML